MAIIVANPIGAETIQRCLAVCGCTAAQIQIHKIARLLQCSCNQNHDDNISPWWNSIPPGSWGRPITWNYMTKTMLNCRHQINLEFENYLSSLSRKNNATLNFVICKTLLLGHTWASMEASLYSVQQASTKWYQDNIRYTRFLRKTSWTQMTGHELNHSVVPKMGKQSLNPPATAKQILEMLHCWTEHTFPFEKYVSKMKQAFTMFKQCKLPNARTGESGQSCIGYTEPTSYHPICPGDSPCDTIADVKLWDCRQYDLLTV